MQQNEQTITACKMAEVWRLNDIRNKKIEEEKSQQRLVEYVNKISIDR